MKVQLYPDYLQIFFSINKMKILPSLSLSPPLTPTREYNWGMLKGLWSGTKNEIIHWKHSEEVRISVLFVKWKMNPFLMGSAFHLILHGFEFQNRFYQNLTKIWDWVTVQEFLCFSCTPKFPFPNVLTGMKVKLTWCFLTVLFKGMKLLATTLQR